MIPISEYTWKEFKNYCLETQFHPGTIFRGQSNCEWHLDPSYTRFIDGSNFRKYFEIILPEAKRLVASYIDYDFDLTSQDDQNRLIGLLQHHGFPTPLLDWTNSPYVAAYFAFIDIAYREPESDYIAVWLFNAEYSVRFIEEKLCECPFHIILPDHRFNKRLLAQDGLFTLSLSPLSLDEELSPIMDELDHPGLLQKVIIPVEESRFALKDLSLMGIHAGNLFEGIDGVCKRLKDHFFMESETALSPRGKRLINAALSRLSGGKKNIKRSK